MLLLLFKASSASVSTLPRSGGSGKRRVEIVNEVIWPDDARHPQHPQNAALDEAPPQPQPVVYERIASVTVDRSRVRPVPIKVEPRSMTPLTDFDRALALLLLAA